MNTKNISMIGLGKLGLPLASIMAKKGFNVIGVDINQNTIDLVNNGKSPIFEPELDRYVKEVGGKKLIATQEHKMAIEKSDITYILTATPSNSDGSFSNKYIRSALKDLSTFLRASDKKYHLFVISSTVVPKSIDDSFIPLIEKFSKRKINEGFGVAYCPDFVALGSVIENFSNPEYLVLGQSSKKAGDIIEKIHHKITDNTPYVGRMSLISAEIAKVSLNAYITTKISFANHLSNICEKFPGANVDDITNTIGQDTRISPKYFKGGMSYGGTCFPRDTYAFNAINEKLGLSTSFIKAVDEINDFQDKHLHEIVINELKKINGNKVSILGLSFKPKTPVITESVGIKLVDNIIRKNSNIEVKVTDPLALKDTEVLFNDNIEYYSNSSSCIKDTDLIVLINSEKEYLEKLVSYKPISKVVLIDCWRVLKNKKLNKNIKVINWGTYLT